MLRKDRECINNWKIVQASKLKSERGFSNRRIINKMLKRSLESSIYTGVLNCRFEATTAAILLQYR